MYLLCMIKARIRWCTCRVENILYTVYRTYKIISSYELARPVMGTIFLVSLMYVYMCVCRGPKSVGGITWAKCAHAQSQYWAAKSDQ